MHLASSILAFSILALRPDHPRRQTNRFERLPRPLQTPLYPPLRLFRSITQRIRRPSRGIIRRLRIHNRELHGGVSLAVGTLRGADGAIAAPDLARSGRDIPAADGAVEELERGEGLVIRYFVARLVDACKSKVCRLLDLAVDGGVRGADVGVAGAGEAWGVDFGCDDFASEPVACFGVSLRIVA